MHLPLSKTQAFDRDRLIDTKGSSPSGEVSARLQERWNNNESNVMVFPMLLVRSGPSLGRIDLHRPTIHAEVGANGPVMIGEAFVVLTLYCLVSTLDDGASRGYRCVERRSVLFVIRPCSTSPSVRLDHFLLQCDLVGYVGFNKTACNPKQLEKTETYFPSSRVCCYRFLGSCILFTCS